MHTKSEFFGEKIVDNTGYLGMPPYIQEAFEAPYIIEVCLMDDTDMKKFSDLIGIDSIVEVGIRSAKSIWFPKLARGERGSSAKYLWVEDVT